MRLLLIIFLFSSCVSFSQTRIVNINRDTIHITGRVFDERGQPLVNCNVYTKSSLQLGSINNVLTDSLGRFFLKGAYLNDTIYLGHLNYLEPYYNQGARYVTIRPKLKLYNISTPAILVTANREQKKPNADFKITVDDGEIFDGGPGCIFPQAYLKHYAFSKKILYPEKAIKNNIEGSVLVAFVVTRDGTVVDFEILNGLGYGCDEEAVRVLKAMPKWSPGICNGRPVAVKYTAAIKFTLTD